MTKLKKRLKETVVGDIFRPEISHSDVAFAYIGLLSQGKSDFDQIEPFRDDDFFALALATKTVPSSPTLRQRLDAAAKSSGWQKILLEESLRLIKKTQSLLAPVWVDGHSAKQAFMPLDIDVSPFDNSQTKKQGVGRTYKGFDGFAPIFAYLGQEGYGVNVAFRPGVDHCQKGTKEFLASSIQHAKELTKLPILVRLDSGNDSADNIRVCQDSQSKADFIIKRNLRIKVTDISRIQSLGEYRYTVIPNRCKDVVVAFYIKTANNPNPPRNIVLTKEYGGDWEVINEGY